MSTYNDLYNKAMDAAETDFKTVFYCLMYACYWGDLPHERKIRPFHVLNWVLGQMRISKFWTMSQVTPVRKRNVVMKWVTEVSTPDKMDWSTSYAFRVSVEEILRDGYGEGSYPPTDKINFKLACGFDLDDPKHNFNNKDYEFPIYTESLPPIYESILVGDDDLWPETRPHNGHTSWDNPPEYSHSYLSGISQATHDHQQSSSSSSMG